MKWLWLVVLGFGLTARGQEGAPDAAQAVTTLKLGTSLVVVPTMVRTKAGEPVFTLEAHDFVVTDDGVEQKVRLEEDTGDQPLALVLVVEAGDAPESKFGDYAGLRAMLETVVGAAEHQVAVVGFDSEPAVVQPFTADLDAVTRSFDHIETGDGGAAPLDALEMAVAMLAKEPPSYRRVIVLVSETVDRNSRTKLPAALRAVSDSNTIIYSLGYSTTRATTKHEAAQMGASDEAGPPHGCFGKYPDVDLEGNPLPARENPKAQGSSVGNKAVQYYDCLSLLAPPLRLAKAAVFAGLNGLKANVPEAAARISGGEYFKTENSKALMKDMVKISNRLPNRYFLSFTPTATHPGLHAISVTLRPERVGVVVEARTSYWQE